jgi:Leucine-rich repeat (LRR) protein
VEGVLDFAVDAGGITMNTEISIRAFVGMTLIVFGLAAGAEAESSRILHFPKDQCLGTVYVEDPCLGTECLELGRDLSLPYGLDPRRVALGGDCDRVGLARGDVAVPAGRNIRLSVWLEPAAEDAPRVAALPPGSYRQLEVDHCYVGPTDLSGLSGLDPNDLFGVVVNCLVPMAGANARMLEPISRLTGLQVLQLHNTGMTNKDVEYLRRLPSLKALGLHEKRVGSPGLAVLKDLHSLEYLDLETTATDAGFKDLGRMPNLRWLRVRMGSIRGPGLAELANLPRLERLSLWGETGLTDRHIQHLEGLTRLKSLTLWGTDYPLTDASLASIGKLAGLEELYFIRIATNFTDAGVAHLKNLKNLKVLELASPIGEEGVRHLADLPNLRRVASISLTADSARTLASFRNLKSVDLFLTDRYAPKAVSALAALTSLEELRFTGSAVGASFSNADLAALESLGHLKRLFLPPGEIDVTDEGMASITKFRQLEYLNLGMARVTKRGLNQLNGLKNLRTLNVCVLPEARPAIDEIPLHLSSLTNLTTLDLRGFALQDADLASLAGMGNLEWLVLDGSLTDGGLWHLRELSALKFLGISSISCSSGEGLAQLAGLKMLGDLNLSGRITDDALGRLTGIPLLWSLTVRTDEPIRPETVEHLRQSLPTVEYVHVDPLTPTGRQRGDSFSPRQRPTPRTRRSSR